MTTTTKTRGRITQEQIDRTFESAQRLASNPTYIPCSEVDDDCQAARRAIARMTTIYLSA